VNTTGQIIPLTYLYVGVQFQWMRQVLNKALGRVCCIQYHNTIKFSYDSTPPGSLFYISLLSLLLSYLLK
jgi:hypothetical protein